MPLPRGLLPSTRPSPGAILDGSHALASGLVGCWTFSEGAGLRMQDASPVNNPMTPGTAWASSPLGTSLAQTTTGAQFHRAVAVPQYLFGAGDFSIEVVFWSRSTDSGQILVAKDDGSAQRDWAIFAQLTPNRISWFNFVTLTETAFTNFALALNARYHVLITRSGTTLTGYLNGQLNGAGTDSSSHIKAVDLAVSGRVAASSFSTANFEMLRLWKGRALTAEQARWTYEEPYGMFLPQRLSRSYSVPTATFQAAWAAGANRLVSGGVSGG